MKKRIALQQRILLLAFLGLSVINAFSQNVSALDSAIHQLTLEKNPEQSVLLMNRIVKKFKLDKVKDAETMDVLYGTVAVTYALNRQYPQFEKYIGLIRNKFNQTSFMNMAAGEMLHKNVDPAYATSIARQTLDLYHRIKNDSTARPSDFTKQDWERFINFAQYPYYDTYAESLFSLKKYSEALHYQQLAFPGKPEDGLPEAVERYANLLELTGNRTAAKQLLLKMARLGRLTNGMTNQLQSMYIAENGSDHNLGAYLDSLQKNVQVSLAAELKPTMQHEAAPEFRLKDLNGKIVSLSDFRGKIVVLDLWATWCRPCIASFPAMQLMIKKHPEVVFLFIDVEEQTPNPTAMIKSFIEKKKYPFTVLIDEPVEPNSSKYKILSAYQPNGIPAKYIIDKNGILRFSTSGFDTDTELINELEAMFSILETL